MIVSNWFFDSDDWHTFEACQVHEKTRSLIHLVTCSAFYIPTSIDIMIALVGAHDYFFGCIHNLISLNVDIDVSMEAVLLRRVFFFGKKTLVQFS